MNVMCPVGDERDLTQSVFPRSAAAVSPENLLEMKILRPCPRNIASETLGVESAVCVLTSTLLFKNHYSMSFERRNLGSQHGPHMVIIWGAFKTIGIWRSHAQKFSV